MNTLVLSNYLEAEFLPGVVYSRWGEGHPSLADFQCVVLDMKLDTDISSTIPSVDYTGFPFYRLFDDVVRLLRVGGVVTCLNYYTFLNTGAKFVASNSKVHNAMLEGRRRTFSCEYKFQGQEETSYDWLVQLKNYKLELYSL